MGSYLSRSSLFYKQENKTGFIKSVLFILLFLLIFTFLPAKLFATTYYTGANGAANTLTNWWTGTGGTGTNPGNFTTAGDIFIIQSPHVMTTSGNWTCTGNTIVINSGGTLTTSTTLTITAAIITIDGTYNAGSTGIITGNMTVGATTGVLALTTISSILTGNFTNNNSVTGTSGQLRVSGSITNTGTIALSTGRIRQTGSSDFTNSGSITFSGAGRIYFSGNFTNTGTLSLGSSDVRLDGTGVGPYNIDGFTTTGLVDVSSNTGAYTFTSNVNCGGIILSGSGSSLNLGTALSHTSTGLVDIGGGEILNGGSSILNISFAGTAFTNAGTFTAATGTINYSGVAQTGLVTTYNNLTLSGSLVKTFSTTPTVNGILSMEETATVTVTTGVVTYGAAATLQYNTATGRTASTEEWKTPFAATGGVIIANTGTINPGANKVFNLNVPLTINALATFNAATRTFSFGGDFINNGTWTASTGAITIALTRATQSIGAFVTTALVSMTKTGGTATFQGNVGGAGLTINGVGGTLNLGASLTHTFTGAVALTNGTLNGGSSTLNVNIVSATAWSGTGTNFTAGTGTVNFGAAGNQTLSATGTKTFYNLTFSNSGIKTNGSTTVNNIFSLEGTATASAAPTYGAAATLQYNTSTNRVAGVEWITPFVATGGVIIANAGVITLNAAKVFTSCPLTVKAGATLNLSTFTLGSPSSLILECGAITGSSITGSGILTLGGDVTVVDVATGTSGATISAPIALGATRTFMVEDDGTTAMDLTVSGIISGATFGITKNNAGTIILSAANTYSGGTSLNAGQLNIDHLTAIGSGALTISANTIIDNTSGGAIGPLTNNNAQTWNGDFTFTGTNDLNMGTGAITMGTDVIITSSTGGKTLTVGGVNNNATRSLTKAGAGNVTFGSATVTLLNFTISVGTLTNTSGDLFLAGDFSNSSTFTHNSGTVTFNGTVAQSLTSGGSSFNNITISGTGGVVASSDFTVDGVLDLQSANVSATQGCLEMSTFTLNMGATATTAGTGDVTGIVQRTSFVANTSYSFGNTYTTLNLVNVGVLPTMVSFKIVLTSTHTWKTDAIHRHYDIIQAGCDAASRITLNLHYLDSELNGANESDMDLFNYFVSTTVLGERGASNVSSIDNWVGLSGLGMLYTAGLSFDQKYWTIGSDVNGNNITWIGGSESGTTDWTLPGNWSGGVPTATSLVHIPGSLTYYPVLPTSTTIGNILIQSGGIVNGTTGAPILTIALGTSAWSNQGAFNAGVSKVIFTNAAATMSGTTNFYNVTVTDGAALELTTNTVMRIAGTLSLSTTGILSAANDSNTVEYNGTAQTVVFPNGITTGYWNLTLSTSGVKTMPSSAINLYGDFAMSGTASATALGAITTAGDFTIGVGTSFTTGAFTHTIGGDFLNDGTFDATGSTIIMNGTIAQSITGASVSFNNLTISNTSAVVSANNDINVTGTFTTNVSTILDMGTSALSVNTVAHSGTLKTQNTSATPITAAKTWGGLVEYNGALNQTVINGTYNDLVISNAGVKTILTATTVNCKTVTFNDAATLEIAGTGLFNILG